VPEGQEVGAPTHTDERPAERRPERLTASRLALAARCPGSFALVHDDHENPAAEKGTEIHAFLEALLAEGILEPQRLVDPAARAVCEAIDPADVAEACAAGLGDLHVEVPFAYDPATGEATILAGEGHRGYYAAPEGSICGTADVVALWDEGPAEGGAPSGRILVSDWKTGARAVEPPRENGQLAFLALCARKALGRPGDRVAAQIAYVESSGEIRTTGHEYSHEELERAEEVRQIARAVEASRSAAAGGGPRAARLVVGAHCRYCPAIARCPAISGAAQSLLEEKDAELTDERVPKIWETLQAVEAAAKRVRARLTDHVANAPDGAVPVQGGRRLRLVESRREKIDPRGAMPVLRAAFGEGADDAVTVSKTGLKKLAGEALPGVMAELEGAGAVEVTHLESLREVGGR
jgi:hypothetical protein